MLIVFAIVHMMDVGSPKPDSIEVIRTYPSLAECWAHIKQVEDTLGEYDAPLCLNAEALARLR